jgi:anti-sigma factor RsiW
MSLKPSALTELMHSVLDGEATDAEARELQRRLAVDPAARAEFDHWKGLFEALGAVPKEHAPEGLVAAVTSGLPKARRTPKESIQPFAGRRVLGHERFGIPTRSVTMTEQSSRRIFAHRKTWIGVGLAAAVAVVVAQIAFDFPLPKDVVGTVVPAQRYRAAQNGSEQVQVGTPGGQTATIGTAPEADRALAGKSADHNAQVRADHSAQLNADRAAEMSAAQRAQMSAANTVQMSAANTAQKNAANTAQMSAANTAQKNAANTAQMNAAHTVQKNADRAAQE